MFLPSFSGGTFIPEGRFIPYSRGTIKDNMIKKNSLYDFRESKSYILNVLNNRLAQSSLFLSYLELYENDTFQELFLFGASSAAR